MKAGVVIALWALSLLPFQLGATPVDIASDVRIDVLDSVPVQELWSLAEPDIVEAAAVVMDIRAFDPEGSPADGRWRGCAIVMIGTGDLAVTPVAARVWTVGPCHLAGRARVLASSKGRVEFEMETGSKERISLVVNAALDVTMNGVMIGRIK